jgi:hypothetical protein
MHPRISSFLARARSWGIAFWIGYAVLLPFFLAPLFSTKLLPGLDVGYHLSIVDMLHKVGDPASPQSAIYDGSFGLKPYCTYYFLLYVLSFAMPLNAAHKLAIGLYIASLPLATGYALRRFGRDATPALFAFPLAYNLNLHYGFISFCVSLPILMLYIALVRRLLDPDEPTRRDYIWVGLCGILLFFTHIQSVALGVMVGGLLVMIFAPGLKRRLLYLATLAPVFAAIAYWQAHGIFQSADPGTSKNLTYALKQAFYARARDAGGSWRADLWNRLGLFPAHLLRGFRDYVDHWYAAAWLFALAVYLIAAILLAIAYREFRPRNYVAGLIPFLIALLLYLALPHHMPDLMTLFPRYTVCVALFAILLLPAGFLRLRWWMAALAFLPLLGLEAKYGVVVARHYAMYQKETAGFIDVMRQAPPNQKLTGVLFDRQSTVMNVESAMVALPAFYPVLRRGPQSFVVLNYCTAAQVPCHVKDPSKLPPGPDPAWGPWMAEDPRVREFFDLFLVRAIALPLKWQKAEGLTLLARSGQWSLYAHDPNAPRAPAPPPKPPLLTW